MNKQQAIEELESMNSGFTFLECHVCDKYNEKQGCCSWNSCDNLKAVKIAINTLKKVN